MTLSEINMRKITFLLLLFGNYFSTFSQTNMQDSTVQVVGYWNNGEKQSYTISENKYKVQNGDTIDREKLTYEVDITIQDSTSDSYTIEWEYKNIVVESANEMLKKIMSYSRLKKATFKTDQFGAFKELLNWKEIRDDISKMIMPMKEEFKNLPNFDKILDQHLSMFSTKESIESTAIQEIQQFYTFHGGKYDINKTIETKTNLPNIYGGTPFDADLTIWVQEVNVDDSNFTLCMEQKVDSIQLHTAVYDYLSKLSTNIGTTIPKSEKLSSLRNTIWTTSMVHDSGWPIYTILTKEIVAEDVQKVQELLIELK